MAVSRLLLRLISRLVWHLSLTPPARSMALAAYPSWFAYKYLYTCLAGTPAQPYSHKG